MANVSELLKSVRVSAEVIRASGTTADLSSTPAQYENLCELLGVELAAKVKGGKILFAVPVADLVAAVDAGKTVTRRAAEVKYSVTKTSTYVVTAEEETVNAVDRLVWEDDLRTGVIWVNNHPFTVAVTTAGELLDNAPNADRTLYFITARVGDAAKILHNGSVAGLIKRLLNFGKLIEPLTGTEETVDADDAE
jgi:hypothetical protein